MTCDKSLPEWLRKTALLLFAAVFAAHACAAPSAVAGDDEQAAPPELIRLLPKNTTLLEYHAADMNRDGLKDWLYVFEDAVAVSKTPDAAESKTRVLAIALRQTDGTLKVVKTNRKVAGCSTCGGMMGDSFLGLTVKGSAFTVENYGGSRWRWSTNYTFAYSGIDQTWQLIRVYIYSYDSTDLERSEKKTYVPPRHFGKIDLADFDPEHYLYRHGAGK